MNDVCKRRLPLDFHSYTQCEPLSLSLWHREGWEGICPWGLSSPVFAGLLLWAPSSRTSSDLPESLPEMTHSNQDRTSCSCLLSIKNCPSRARAFKVLCYLCQVSVLLSLKWGWPCWVCVCVGGWFLDSCLFITPLQIAYALYYAYIAEIRLPQKRF